jgi:hypothetical protein
MFARTYIDIVIEFYSARAIQLNLPQCLSHDIVRLSLRLLSGFNNGGLVEVSLVIDVEFTEGILKAEDLVLLELRILPAELFH